MSHRLRAAVLLVIAAMLVAGATWMLLNGETIPPGRAGTTPRQPRSKQPSGSTEPGPSHPPGFEDHTFDAGIDFRMSFLPEEQGEKFKINLYDHGCGVVVGDYDGDGYDDVYLLNQLGPNALYKNDGKGHFIDV